MGNQALQLSVIARVWSRKSGEGSGIVLAGCVVLGSGDAVSAAANAGMPPSKTNRGRICFAVQTGLPWLIEQ